MAGLRSIFGGRTRAQQLKDLEERSANPTKGERTVVRPDKPVKKRKKVVMSK